MRDQYRTIIIMALIWPWKVDGFKPERWNMIGALIAILDACIIIYMPGK